MTLSHVRLATLLSMLLALGMACKSSEPPAAQPQAASEGTAPAANGDEPAAAAPEGATTNDDGDDDGDDDGESPEATAQQGDGTPEAPAAGRADIAQFQAVFTPVWSTKPDAERAKRACAVADELKTRVEAIDKRSAPAGADGETWLSAVEQLQDYVGEIGVYCDDGEDADTDGIVDLVSNAHESLQAVTKMLPR